MNKLEPLEHLSLTKEQLVSLGAEVEFDPDEADALGAFTEDAVDEVDILKDGLSD